MHARESRLLVKCKDCSYTFFPVEFLGDNVHLTAPGYSKLVDGITDCFKRAVGSGISAAVNVPGVPVSASSFFWRGFSSPNGSARPKNTASHYNHTGGQDHGKWGRRHPYRGRWVNLAWAATVPKYILKRFHKIIFCRLCTPHSRVETHESFRSSCHIILFFLLIRKIKDHHVSHSANTFVLSICLFCLYLLFTYLYYSS